MHQMMIIRALLTSLASAREFARAAEQGVPVQLDWPISGHNNQNTRCAATQHIIDAGNVSRLKPKWSFTTAGEAQRAGAAIDGGADGFRRRMG